MWCTFCQQDVPGLVPGGQGPLVCSRCGRPLDTACRSGQRSDPAHGPDDRAPRVLLAEAPTSVPAACDTWELEQQLQHIQRLLTIYRMDLPNGGTGDEQTRVRVDTSHRSAAHRHNPPRHRSRRSAPRRTGRPGGLLGAVTWTLLSLGIMALACGAVLLGWSALAGREALWSTGMPITVAGQLLLLMGFVLQVDRLWHDHRTTAQKLDQVDHRLERLRDAVPAGRASPTPAAPHTAGSSGPDTLLADLKNQLDQLAVRLARCQTES